MPRFSRLKAGFALSLLVLELACQKRQVPVPVPTPPARIQPAPPPAAATTSSPPASPATTAQPDEQNPYQVNKPPQPTPAVRKPARSAAAPASTAPPAPTPAPVPAPAAPPKLGDVLTPDEQRQYSAAIDQSLSHAQTSLSSIGGQQLNKEQQAELEQIQGFMQRARVTRESDPAGAKSLSQRAEVLARDLAASFH
jgi:hypothetical protein